MGDEPGELATHQGAQAYFTRFDQASAKLDPWPPRGEADGSPEQPSLTAPHASGARLRCEAGQPCPRSGFWFTPAQANSPRRFDAGQVMPQTGGDYSTTIWQWDEQQAD